MTPRYFAVGDRLAADLGDGRCAILHEFAQRPAQWALAPAIPADLLTPPAAPVVADRADGSVWLPDGTWRCSCPRYHPPGHVGCAMCFDRRPTPTP